jgi:hypothetical protein
MYVFVIVTGCSRRSRCSCRRRPRSVRRGARSPTGTSRRPAPWPSSPRRSLRRSASGLLQRCQRSTRAIPPSSRAHVTGSRKRSRPSDASAVTRRRRGTSASPRSRGCRGRDQSRDLTADRRHDPSRMGCGVQGSGQRLRTLYQPGIRPEQLEAAKDASATSSPPGVDRPAEDRRSRAACVSSSTRTSRSMRSRAQARSRPRA